MDSGRLKPTFSGCSQLISDAGQTIVMENMILSVTVNVVATAAVEITSAETSLVTVIIQASQRSWSGSTSMNY
jgi:hypothetical protein